MIMILLPFLFSLTLPFNSIRIRDLLTYFYIIFLSFLALTNFSLTDVYLFDFSHIYHNIFKILDVILLVFFFYVGYKYKSKLVLFLAVAQLLLYMFILTLTPIHLSSDILVDKISSTMLLVINIVGGVIIIYALKYIQSEEFKECKKNMFIAILFFFLAVMNLIVTTNNLEIFFFAFELTTLCSYLLIRYREDEISIANALQALWMNQIGGLAILIALLLTIFMYDTIYLDILLKNSSDVLLLPLSLLVIAAFVKGASLPFNKWLLGAMVAPTPVSAILHSATMVKIAPYLILKIAPAFSPVLATIVVFSGSFVFMAASLMALSKDYFKEILGLSTIALLALMMAISSIGTPEAINIALILIVFHAISKALLFLQAGILEKVYHLKYLQDIYNLSGKSSLVVFFILIGFGSLTLPPFGAFLGKFASIELLSSLIEENIFYLFSLVFVLIGSVFLTLLYFKVVTKLLPSGEGGNTPKGDIAFTYKLTSFILVFLLLVGIFISFRFDILSLTEIIIPTILIGILPILFYRIKFADIKKTTEYNCGEKDDVVLSAYYFNISKKLEKTIFFVSILLIVSILLGGIL
ncbi:MAG: proton-conducting transporter membrane subunit [Campylobacterota bacterium]|nr:proton-conducting transporter membrane subunit [Campylobacterota bacterium]